MARAALPRARSDDSPLSAIVGPVALPRVASGGQSLNTVHKSLLGRVLDQSFPRTTSQEHAPWSRICEVLT